MEINKNFLEKLINEVIESGSNQKITLSCDDYIDLEFDMLEYKRELFPVCNVYLFNSKENLVKALFTTRIEKGKIITEGSIDEIFNSCKILSEEKH